MKKLLIDDTKDIQADKIIRYWFDAIKYLICEKNEIFDELLLDYYLDSGHTGLEILQECIWNEKYSNTTILPNKITLVSSDKSCNKIMEKFLVNNGFKKEIGWSFKRIIDNEKT